jgi:hypothetical protein
VISGVNITVANTPLFTSTVKSTIAKVLKISAQDIVIVSIASASRRFLLNLTPLDPTPLGVHTHKVLDKDSNGLSVSLAGGGGVNVVYICAVASLDVAQKTLNSAVASGAFTTSLKVIYILIYIYIYIGV